MNLNVIGLLGQAGVGKDTIAEMIAPTHPVDLGGFGWTNVRDLLAPTDESSRRALCWHAAQIALADPIKEIARRVFDFSIDQLWGPSTSRNQPDKRYPRSRDGKIDYLTAREALQTLGTEWARDRYADTWIDLGLRRARELLTTQRIRRPDNAHTFAASWIVDRCDLVVISDIRFVNEVRAIREAGGQVWKIERPSSNGTLSGNAAAHRSETEQQEAAAEIDTLVTHRILNDGTIDDLRVLVAGLLHGARAA